LHFIVALFVIAIAIVIIIVIAIAIINSIVLWQKLLSKLGKANQHDSFDDLYRRELPLNLVSSCNYEDHLHILFFLV
jgi:hypothetical protein